MGVLTPRTIRLFGIFRYETLTTAVRVVEPFFTLSVQYAALFGATNFDFLIEQEPFSVHFAPLVFVGVMIDVSDVFDFFFTQYCG